MDEELKAAIESVLAQSDEVCGMAWCGSRDLADDRMVRNFKLALRNLREAIDKEKT